MCVQAVARARSVFTLKELEVLNEETLAIINVVACCQRRSPTVNNAVTCVRYYLQCCQAST